MHGRGYRCQLFGAGSVRWKKSLNGGRHGSGGDHQECQEDEDRAHADQHQLDSCAQDVALHGLSILDSRPGVRCGQDKVAHPAGFEPAIPSFVDWCLIQFGHGCEGARILIDRYIIWQSSKRSTLVESHEKKFRGWRLLGVIFLVVVALAAVSFALDVMVVGPLEGR